MCWSKSNKDPSTALVAYMGSESFNRRALCKLDTGFNGTFPGGEIKIPQLFSIGRLSTGRNATKPSSSSLLEPSSSSLLEPSSSSLLEPSSSSLLEPSSSSLLEPSSSSLLEPSSSSLLEPSSNSLLEHSSTDNDDFARYFCAYFRGMYSDIIRAA